MADTPKRTSNTILIGVTLQGTLAPTAPSCCVGPHRPIEQTSRSTFNGQNYYSTDEQAPACGLHQDRRSVAHVTNQINSSSLIKMMTRNGGRPFETDEIR